VVRAVAGPRRTRFSAFSSCGNAHSVVLRVRVFCRMAPPRNLHRPGFSLIETLLVVFIIVIISVSAFAALSGTGTGLKLTSAGNRLASIALLARQNSLTKNAMTAMVMIAGSGTEGDYRAFALFEIAPRTDGEPAGAGDWAQLSAWESMPDGITVDACTFAANTVNMAPPFPALTFRGAAVSAYQYVVFLPNGSLLRSDPSCVRLAPGLRSPGTRAVTYTIGRTSDGTPANYYQVCLLPASGRVKIQRP